MLHTLVYSRVRDSAKVPTRGSTNAAGWDLYNCGAVKLAAGQRASIPVGMSFELPLGTYGRIVGRSGVARRLGLVVHGGVIDPDFRGEVQLIAFNLGQETIELEHGARIAQLVVEEYRAVTLQSSDGAVAAPVANKRGKRGFGSSGLYSPTEDSYKEFWRDALPESQVVRAADGVQPAESSSTGSSNK